MNSSGLLQKEKWKLNFREQASHTAATDAIEKPESDGPQHFLCPETC